MLVFLGFLTAHQIIELANKAIDKDFELDNEIMFATRS